eukprot:746364-Hanusia_phi.AAC.3
MPLCTSAASLQFPFIQFLPVPFSSSLCVLLLSLSAHPLIRSSFSFISSSPPLLLSSSPPLLLASSPRFLLSTLQRTPSTFYKVKGGLTHKTWRETGMMVEPPCTGSKPEPSCQDPDVILLKDHLRGT